MNCTDYFINYIINTQVVMGVSIVGYAEAIKSYVSMTLARIVPYFAGQ